MTPVPIISGTPRRNTDLAFIEAGSTIESEVRVPGRCIYWVAFIDSERLLGRDAGLGQRPLASKIGFESSTMALAINNLRSELTRNDELSTLYLESWATQTLVLLHRSFDAPLPRAKARFCKDQLSKAI